jgi:hypothetical protein
MRLGWGWGWQASSVDSALFKDIGKSFSFHLSVDLYCISKTVRWFPLKIETVSAFETLAIQPTSTVSSPRNRIQISTELP